MSEDSSYEADSLFSPNLIARFAGIILAPRRTLTNIVNNPAFWQPLMVLAIAFIGIRLTMLSDITAYYSTDEFREIYAESRGTTDEAAAKEIETLIRTAPLIVLIEAPLTIVIGTLGVAGLFYFIGVFGFKQKIYYKKIICMTAWCSVVSAIPMLLNIPLKLINSEWFLPTSLSAILSPALVGEYLSNVFSIVDLFLIWQAWLFSIGLSILFGVSIQRAVTAVGTLFVCLGIFNALMLK